MLGEHKVVVVGFDKFQEVVYLSDYAWKNFKAVSFNDLRKARNSKSKIAAPKNAIYAVYPFPPSFSVNCLKERDEGYLPSHAVLMGSCDCGGGKEIRQ